MMRMMSLIGRLSLAVGLTGAGQYALAADGTWIGQTGFPRPWLSMTNWSGGAFPGETNNPVSLNADVATITNAVLQPTLVVDFSAPADSGHLTLGAIVASRTNLPPNSTPVRPAVNGGTLTLNGANVNGKPNTILASRGTGNDNFFIGDATAKFATLRLGRVTNVIQMGAGKWISVAAAISERNPGSGITVTSDTGEVLVDNPGAFNASFSNTFTGPVRIEKGARWDLSNGGNTIVGNPQTLGLSSPDAANLVLDNGVLRGRTVQIGRLFTLGPGGGRLEAAPGISFFDPFAFTNTGAIGFEGAGPRTLTLASDTPLIVSRVGVLACSIGDAPGGGKTSLVKTNESAAWTLTGSNTYSGDTTIYGGSLALSGNGSFANSLNIILAGCYLSVSDVTGGANYDGARFALASGQKLMGNGTVTAAMSVRGGATIAPGDMQTRDLVFTSPSALMAVKVDLGATLSADLLHVWNAGLDLGGAALNVSLLNAPAAASTRTFLLIDNNGTDAITNQFGLVKLVGANATSYQVTVDYAFTGTDSLGRVGDGNDLAITLAPATVSPPFSLSINVANSIATLTWPSISNQTYWVQYKSALTNANWEELPGEVIATGTSVSKTDPIGWESRFYRVRTQ